MPPNKDNEICQNCGYTFRTHQLVMGGPTALPITCPTAPKNTTNPLFIFVESGWYEGPPEEEGFGYMQLKDPVRRKEDVSISFVGYWNKVTHISIAARYFPLAAPPKLVPMPKGKVNAT